MNALACLPDVDLLVAETHSSDDHGWDRRSYSPRFRLETLSSTHKATRGYKLRADFAAIAAAFAPDIIVLNGYADATIRAEAARVSGAVLCFWSESTEYDHTRNRIREIGKRMLVRQFDGALVAGEDHRDYITKLGMHPANIAVVGGCVDNDYFSAASDAIRRGPGDYFLYVGRFIPKKNLPTLLAAYELYRERTDRPWNLVLVGSGPQEPELARFVATKRLEGVVLAGLQQIEALPSFYANAGCFVLPSSIEPWGLVVNEAMASGLPVILSSKCGCRKDLLREGVNGFSFSPDNPEQLAERLSTIASGKIDLQSFGRNSREIVRTVSLDRFASRTVSLMRRLRAEHLGRRMKLKLRRTVLRGLAAVGSSTGWL
jgi:glycosyltransferase involved in cell wall biosynthesis